MLELTDYVPINLICMVALGALGLRRLVRMDGYHELRVVILTGLLWLPALYLFFLAFLALVGPYGFYNCTPAGGPDVYAVAEV